MGYNTTGQSHKNGLKNESDSKKWIENNVDKHNVDFLSQIKEVKKQGGTKNKNDLIISYNDGRILGISAKNRQNSGTFDWVNTSSAEILRSSILDEVRNLQKEIRNLPPEERKDQKDKFTNFRVNKAQQFLDSIDHDQINGLLLKTFEPVSYQKVMINNKKNKKIYFFDGSNHPVFKYINNPLYKFILKRIKTEDEDSESAKLYAVPINGGSDIDLNLRIRQVTNNGDSAALGIKKSDSSANKNSSLVIKLQQENIDNLFRILETKNQLMTFENE